jgi:hypothetical protein
MPRTVDWYDLEGENAFVVMGNIGRLLRGLARESGNPALEGIDARYREEAMSGDYEHLLDVSHRYAFEHLRETLHVPEDR